MNTVSLNIALSGETLSFVRHTAGRFCVKGWSGQRHSNILDELHIVLSGSCQLEVEESLYDLYPGSAILVRAGEFHALSEPQPDIERCAFLLSVPRDGHLDKQFDLLSGGPFTISNEVVNLCRQLDREADLAAPYCKDMLAAKLACLLIEILRQVDTADTENADSYARTSLQNMLVAIDRFFAPWPNAIGSEADLCRQLNISRHKLNRIVRRHYGTNFRQKLYIAKMDYASWLLRRTDYHCRKVAMLCGYSADTAFYKAFRINFGMPPQTYRKKFREEKEDETIYNT